MATSDTADVPKGQGNEGNQGKPSEAAHYHPHQGSDLATAQAHFLTNAPAQKDQSSEIIPKAIKKHRLSQDYNMKGPWGSEIRKDQANQQVDVNYQDSNSERALKYVKEKDPLVSPKEIENKGVLERWETPKGELAEEFSKDKGSERS